MFGRRQTLWACPSLLMFHIDWPVARISSSLVLYQVSPQWFFHFGEEIVITWTHIGWVRWMYQNLSLPAAQEVRDSSSVIPCIVMKNDEVLYHQLSSFSPESIRLRSLCQSERTTAKNPVQHKRWTYPCYRAVSMEQQQRWRRWWCTTASKHLTKGDK